MPSDRTKAGTFYEHDAVTGRLRERGPALRPGEKPDVWICRRLMDYPGRRPPDGAAVEHCTLCDRYICFNPMRHVDAPKICMQCAGIEPLPFPGVHR